MEKVHVHAKFFIYRPYSQFTNQREIHITVRSFWIDRLTYQIGPILCTSMRKSLLSSLYIALCGGCKASVNCCQNRRFFCSLLPCHIRQVLWLSMTFSCGVEMVKSLEYNWHNSIPEKKWNFVHCWYLYWYKLCFLDKSVVSDQVHQVDIRGKSSGYCGLYAQFTSRGKKTTLGSHHHVQTDISFDQL